MNAAEAIVQEVSCSANLRNGEVIERAFIMSARSCPCCNYPEHAREYEDLLEQYEYANLKLHHANRKAGESWAQGRAALDIALRCREHYKLEVASLKAEMKPFRPCHNCKLEYNPTHKPSLGYYHRPKLQPAEEFLNV